MKLYGIATTTTRADGYKSHALVLCENEGERDTLLSGRDRIYTPDEGEHVHTPVEVETSELIHVFASNVTNLYVSKQGE